MKTVVLVPRRAGFEDRDRIWKFCRTWWANDHEWEIFEGDHDNGGPFNRAAALNSAADAAGDWDAAVCIDADVLLDAKQVRSAVSLALVSGGPVLAYDERVHLTTRGTQRVMQGYTGNWMNRGFVEATLRDSCSSAYVITRELWDAVGGFDETFVGWGWEDVAFRCATETVSGIELVKISGKLFHLHHVVSCENNRREPTFIANQARGERYREARWDADRMEELLAESARPRRSLAVRAPESSVAGHTIPRILHRTVPAETSEEVEKFWARACELHPGWEHCTWRDPLDPADWPLTSAAWDACTSGAQRAGLIRLEALVRDGGIYLDSDVELYRPLDSLLGVPAFASWEDRKTIPDAVLGACPHHPIFERMLEQAVRAVELGFGAWESGPGITTSMLPGRADVLLLPPGSWYPYHWTERDRRADDHRNEQPWAFGAHHWAASWLTPAQLRAQNRHDASPSRR